MAYAYSFGEPGCPRGVINGSYGFFGLLSVEFGPAVGGAFRLAAEHGSPVADAL